jgi:hypothetical protein
MQIGRISAVALVVVSLAGTSAYAGQNDKKPPKTHTAPKPKPHTARAHTAPKTHTAHARPQTPRHVTARGNSVHPAGSIRSRPQVVSRIQPLIPSGMTLENAESGFRNQNQFVAALHASQNLGIPFPTLKSAMTGNRSVSLAEAIREMRPSADWNTEAKRAEMQAASDLLK